MNLYGYTGLNHNKALNDWELRFGINNGFNEKESSYEIEVVIFEDKRDYEPVEKKDGTTFTPPSNEFEKFRVLVEKEPLDLDKMDQVELVNPFESFVMGANSYNPTITIRCDSLEKV